MRGKKNYFKLHLFNQEKMKAGGLLLFFLKRYQALGGGPFAGKDAHDKAVAKVNKECVKKGIKGGPFELIIDPKTENCGPYLRTLRDDHNPEKKIGSI